MFFGRENPLTAARHLPSTSGVGPSHTGFKKVFRGWVGEALGPPARNVLYLKKAPSSAPVCALGHLPPGRESIVETQKETSKRKGGKDMEEQTIKGADTRSILNAGLGINPMKEGLNRLA